MWKLAGDETRKVVSRAISISKAAATANAGDEMDKGTGADNGPGQVVVREVRQEAKPRSSASREQMNAALPMGRRMTVATASPKAVGCPARAAVIRLVIDNGDRPERREEQLSGRSIAQARGGRRASNLVRLVHSAASS